MPAFVSLVQPGKRRLSQSSSDHDSRKRRPLGNPSDGIANDPTKVGEQYWMVQWRVPQTKKHKTWDGDGVLVLSGGKGILYDMDGRVLASGKPSPDGACIGTQIFLGGKEMEVDNSVSRSDYLSGKVFGKGNIDDLESGDKPRFASAPSLKKKFVPLQPRSQNSLAFNPKASNGGLNFPKKRSIDLEPVDLVQNKGKALNTPCSVATTFWSASWRKPQTKKHKTWDGDAFIIHSEKKLTMISDDGKLLGTTSWDGVPLHPGRQLQFPRRVAELDTRVPENAVPRIIGSVPFDGPIDDEMGDVEALAINEEYIPGNSSAAPPLVHDTDAVEAVQSAHITPSIRKKFVPPTCFLAKPEAEARKEVDVKPMHDPGTDGAIVMKMPTLDHQTKFNPKGRPVVPVIIDPILGNRLRPHQVEGVKFLYECVLGLRSHEGQGCILADEMGMGKTLQTIALVWTLLSKGLKQAVGFFPDTNQEQNPYASGSPVVGKVLIVCPTSLIENWKKEFHKWVGRDRIGVFAGNKDKSTVKQFINSRIHQVLVIGYEKLRTVIDELAYCMPPIGLIICDEGHRLKSANNKTTAMFNALKTPRRIILSGTPIQNDLSEFHAMAQFCNPGLLDDYPTFRKVFETPILKSRAPGCSEAERELGEARQAHLQAVARSFVLRRDAGILNTFLPPKHEYVVFVTPSTIQKAMFMKILQPDTLASLIRGSMARSLAMIQYLTKLSSSPLLLRAAIEKQISKTSEDDDVPDTRGAIEDALKLLPATARLEDVSQSGKLTALSVLLRHIRKETEEKCILVSHYTSTLNVMEAFCKKNYYNFLRLDGQTPVAKRQEYVDTFNRAPQSRFFIFLLSSKAGGIGLNLIGASRLFLIDSDWNPSHDLQSMARIHRDGQKRPVFIYRFLTAGTIDEKIYQRQVTKLGLSDSLMGKGTSESGKKSKSDSFTPKELRDLFTFHCRTASHTHELLGCACITSRPREDHDDSFEEDGTSDVEKTTPEKRKTGFISASQCNADSLSKMDKAFVKKKKAELASLGEWTHINCFSPSSTAVVADDVLQHIITNSSTLSKSTILEEQNNFEAIDEDNVPNNIPEGTISFIFEKVSKSLI